MSFPGSDMKMQNIAYYLILSIGLVCAAPKTSTKPLSKPSATPSVTIAEARRAAFDTTAIHKQYVEGDFEEAIDKLESALKYVTPLSHDDSVFIFKHLGVMYTAKYETREKGKQFMMRLLDVEPTARLMDMYASDMIYMIFKNIQDEYEIAKAKLRRTQDLNTSNATQEANANGTLDKTDGKPGKKASYKWIPWTAAALAATGGVVLAVTLMNEEEPAVKENVVQWNQ